MKRYFFSFIGFLPYLLFASQNSNEALTFVQTMPQDQVSQEKYDPVVALQYSFFVAIDDLSTQAIEKKASQIASDLAKEKGYSHYNILSREEVYVIIGKTDWPSPYNFPQNLYEEKIVQRDYSKRLNEKQFSDHRIHNAYLYKIILTK